MPKAKRVILGIALVSAAVVAGFLVIGAYSHWKQSTIPLGEPPLIKNPPAAMSLSGMQQFFDGDFQIVKDFKSLPHPVVMEFTESGGSRLTIANPGEKFEATDVIWDASLPRRRLLFAGVSERKSFVLYEQGGIGLFYVLALFKLDTRSTTPAIWRTYCGPAAGIEELRADISQGKCSRPVVAGPS